MDEITGHDLDDIELYCKQLREGHIDDDEFRTNVIASMGFDPEVIKGEQEHKEIAALWE